MSAFYGGASYAAITGQLALVFGSPRVVTVSASSSPSVKLPSALNGPLGGCQFYIISASGSSASCPIKDFDGNTLATITADQCAKCCLANNQSSAGKWVVRVLPVNTARTAYAGTRTKPSELTAQCPASMAKYVLVKCDDPTKVIYSSDPAFASAAGKFVKMGTPPYEACWAVYKIRLSMVYPEGPAPAFTTFNSCKECGATGNGDDSGIEPSSQVRVRYKGSDSEMKYEF